MLLLCSKRFCKSIFYALFIFTNQVIKLYACYAINFLHVWPLCVIIVISFLSACDSLAFDEVDFDEPMELGAEQQEETAAKTETELEVKPSVKMEPKTEPKDEVLM